MNDRKLKTIRAVLTALTVAAVLFIFWNSSRSAAESTEQSSPLTDMINRFLGSLAIPLTVTQTFVRKAAHFTEYAVLGALLGTTVYLYCEKRGRTLTVALPLGAAVAVCDELIQLFPAGRSCEVRDMAIDFSGVVFAVLLIVLFITMRHHKKG